MTATTEGSTRLSVSPAAPKGEWTLQGHSASRGVREQDCVGDVERVRIQQNAADQLGLHSTMKRPAVLLDEPHNLTVPCPIFKDKDSMDRAEVQICGTLSNVSAVVGSFLDRFAEVEADEDARIRVFVRRLGESGIRAQHR